MSKFWIGEPGQEEITEICWVGKEGEDEGIEEDAGLINLPSCVWKEDVPKLIKALQKAKELGWWKEEDDKP